MVAKKTRGKIGKVIFNKMLRDINEGNLSITSDEEEINLMSEHDSEGTVSDFEGSISMEDLLKEKRGGQSSAEEEIVSMDIDHFGGVEMKDLVEEKSSGESSSKLGNSGSSTLVPSNYFANNVVGLKNEGNLCFFNSVIQNLY